jgi:hypothetical protein
MTNMDLPSRDLTAERLLDSLHFEDDRWPWEVVWDLNARCPEADQDEKVGLVEVSLRGRRAGVKMGRVARRRRCVLGR